MMVVEWACVRYLTVVYFFNPRNTLRTVEVWLDDYKSFYYQKVPYARGRDYGE